MLTFQPALWIVFWPSDTSRHYWTCLLPHPLNPVSECIPGHFWSSDLELCSFVIGFPCASGPLDTVAISCLMIPRLLFGFWKTPGSVALLKHVSWCLTIILCGSAMWSKTSAYPAPPSWSPSSPDFTSHQPWLTLLCHLGLPPHWTLLPISLVSLSSATLSLPFTDSFDPTPLDFSIYSHHRNLPHHSHPPPPSKQSTATLYLPCPHLSEPYIPLSRSQIPISTCPGPDPQQSTFSLTQ